MACRARKSPSSLGYMSTRSASGGGGLWQIESKGLPTNTAPAARARSPPRTVSDAQVAQVIERTLNTTPRDVTHWSIRSMAAETGLSHTTIRRIWSAFGPQPHQSETFKLSTDPLFV